MEYRYLPEKLTNTHITINELHDNGINIIYVLCYYVEEQCKYPFLQFLMERIPNCEDIIEDQLTMPYIMLYKNTYIENIETIVFEKIQKCLKNAYASINFNEEMYKGVLYGKDGLSCYMLVNITGTAIDTTNNTLFVLTSEIINTKSAYDIPIDKEVVNLFSNNPEMGLLTNKHGINTFIVPDSVYTISDKKTTEFMSIFGNIKTKVYESCGEYYFFYRSFKDVVSLCKNKEYGINRYALFIEGKLYMEQGKDLNLTDNIIENLYPEPCIIICYLKHNNVKPDIIVKSYDNFKCISYR
jgi:hypothetical protein